MRCNTKSLKDNHLPLQIIDDVMGNSKFLISIEDDV